MKVIIKESADKRGIRLHLPLAFIKTRIFSKYLSEHNDDGNYDPEELKHYRENIKQGYKVLKKYIKENGHFNLVEVYSNDGGIVLIRV